MSRAPMTAKGAQRLRAELDELKSVKRPAVIHAIADSFSIRREALQHRVTYSTTIFGASALLNSLDHRGTGDVNALQALHQELKTA